MKLSKSTEYEISVVKVASSSRYVWEFPASGRFDWRFVSEWGVGCDRVVCDGLVINVKHYVMFL